MFAPEDGTYEVYVHYYNRHGDGTSIATVRVWIYGAEVFAGNRALASQNDTWHVGTVAIPSGSFTADLGPNTSVPPPGG